jgi:L-aspartate semialdehyde sulfurtransferase ferredoxin
LPLEPQMWFDGVFRQSHSVRELTLTMRKKFFCTFPQGLISEPIISHTLGERFAVIPNIRAASISDTMALVAVEIEGEADAIDESVAYLRERGVKVEEMTENEDLPGA